MTTEQLGLKLVKPIVKREAGWADDPDDPGGATKHGITLAFAKDHRIRANGKLILTKDELHKLSLQEAGKAMVSHIFIPKMMGVYLSGRLAGSVFDQAVHSGAATAIKMLQRILHDCGADADDDGILGPETQSAVEQVSEQCGDALLLVDAYGEMRRERYLALMQARPQFAKYCITQRGGKGGWIKRAEDYMRPRSVIRTDDWKTWVKHVRPST